MGSSFRSVALRELLAETKDGEWGSDTADGDAVEMVVIRGTDFDTVRAGSLHGVPRRYIAAKAAGRKTLRPLDILIETAGGSKDRPTGRTVFMRPALFERSTAPLICASFARYLRVDAEAVLPEYVYWSCSTSTRAV